MIHLQRATDKDFLCRVALRASPLWDWVDKRQIDRHAVSLAILYGTVKVLQWAMGFAAEHPDIDGLHMAAIMGAVTAPYMALQGAAIKFYFEARDK